MRSILMVLVAAFSLSAGGVHAQERERVENRESDPVQVMILGSYHFANPGLDGVNFEADDMLAPRRQREIAILVDSLAQWQPTRVLVESQAEAPHFRMGNYGETANLLTTQRNESIQIGYRLASQLGHDAVYGFDERAGEGEPDYFPMNNLMQFAAANDQAWIIEEMMGELQQRVAEEQALLSEQSVAESLLFHNDGSAVEAQHDWLYLSMMQVGDGDSQPGAEINAYWFMRNAKMFSKLMMIAEPGDRVIAIVGSGHATWLRDMARRTPGFELVEAEPFVRAAAIASEIAAD